MKYLILTPAAHGHLNPTLPLAAELTSGGDRVVYYLPEAMSAIARANGAEVRPLDPRLEMPAQGILGQLGNAARRDEWSEERQREVADKLSQYRTRQEVALLDLRQQIAAERADALIYDTFGFWVASLARQLDAPRIAYFPTFAIPDGQFPLALIGADGRTSFPFALAATLRESMAFADFSAPYQAEGLNLVFQPRSFQPDGGTFDERYLFVGPSIRHEVASEDFPFDQLGGRRIVFVSLGTVASDHPDFYRSCFEAFADSDWLVVAATGRTDPAKLGPLPANVLARPFVPQLAVLERARAFVSHGGVNSTMESLWLGVPLVVVPQLGDQPLVAQRIEDLGLGAALSPDGLTGFAIREAVDRVATDPMIACRIAGLVSEIRLSGGAARAADAVRHFVGGEKNQLQTRG